MHDSIQFKRAGSIGVLLVNLGTPDKPDSASIRRFLREFLSDHRVVEIPRIAWMLILHLFILPFRPQKLVKAYQSIWTEEGAPLLAIAYKQQQKLQQLFNNSANSTDSANSKVHQDKLIFATAMSYGNPSIALALQEFKNKNIEKILVLPLYPQYSGSTTAAIFDQVSKILQSWRNIPELRFIKDYYNHPLYINALAESVIQNKKSYSSSGTNSGLNSSTSSSANSNTHLLMSFHGIPIDYCKKGDPYNDQCQQTAKLLATALNLEEHQWTISFQSLFGKAQWLKPYTNETLSKLPEQGIKDINIICPGFSNDCLETLEEIKIENKQVFIDAGGNNYHYIPALNDSDEHIQFLKVLVETHSQNW